MRQDETTAEKTKSWRPSGRDMKRLASLYGACKDVRNRSVRPLPRIVAPDDVELFTHLVERITANFDGPYGRVGVEAARCWESPTSDASELGRSVASFRQRGGKRAQLSWLANLAQRFCEGVISAFDVLHETKDGADAERKERAAERNEIKNELTALRQSRKDRVNRAGVILALPALFSAAVACQGPVVSETGSIDEDAMPASPPLGMRDRRWCPIKKDVAGANLTVRDDFDILRTIEVDEVAIAGYPDASGFIWRKRQAIAWPPLPTFTPTTARGVATSNPTAAMLLEWPGMEDWALKSVDAAIEANKGQSKLHQGEEQFVAFLNRIHHEGRQEIISTSPVGGQNNTETPFYELMDAIFSICQTLIDMNLFSNAGKSIQTAGIRDIVRRTLDNQA